MSTLTERFSSYFDRDVAQTAAKSLSNGAEMEVRAGSETFTFTKKSGKNSVVPGPASDPQLVFILTHSAAEAILGFESNVIGEIGIHIAKLVASKDPEKRISVQFKSGFLGLFSKGYFGVLGSGRAHFASYLASQGLNGIAGIKAFLGKMKS